MIKNNQLSKINFVIACVLLLLPACVMAAGVGFYVSPGYGEGGYSGNDASRTGLPDLTYSRIRFGGGVVFDNAVASMSIFNYRLNIGAEGIADNVEDPTYGTYNFSGVRVNWLNDFGFALIRAPGLRWWVGPQQGFFYLDEADASGNAVASFDGALGVVTGVNFNMRQRFTIGLDMALRYVVEIASKAVRPPEGDFDASYVGNGAEFAFTVSFLIRGRNTYHRYRR